MVLELLVLELAALSGRSSVQHGRAGTEVRLRVRDATPARRGVGHPRPVLGGLRGKVRVRVRARLGFGFGFGFGC